MDPTIYYCALKKDNKDSLKNLPIVTYPSIHAFQLDLDIKTQIKYKDYISHVRSHYLKTEDSLLFANIDAIFNFSQRSGGALAPQEEKERVFYAKGRFSKGLAEYLSFRFVGADGMIVRDDIDDLNFKLHLLEVPNMNYYEMNHQLARSFGHGIDVYLALGNIEEIYLAGRHLKETGYGLFFFDANRDKLTGKEFRKLLSLFNSVSVFKPLILTGTPYFFCVCFDPHPDRSILVSDLNLEPPPSTYELENFEKMVEKTFAEQNRLNLFDRSVYNLSKASVIWNIH